MKKKRLRGSMTLTEWDELVKNDPEWLATQERKRGEDRKRQAWSDILADNDAALVVELRAAGFDVRSPWDLFNRKEPWRKDVPIPPYPEAVPILVRHFDRPYHFVVREGIVRALTDRNGRVAFDRLVEEFIRTRDTGDEERARAFDLIFNDPRNLYSHEQLQRITAADWDGFREAIANAIAYLFQKEHIPLVLELIQDQGHGNARLLLVMELRKKMRRWRRSDAAVIEVLKTVAKEPNYVGNEARKALKILAPDS